MLRKRRADALKSERSSRSMIGDVQTLLKLRRSGLGNLTILYLTRDYSRYGNTV